MVKGKLAGLASNPFVSIRCQSAGYSNEPYGKARLANCERGIL